MLRLRLLGSVDLSGADGRDGATVLAQPKRVALLAYLAAATPRGFHRRDTLLPLLWPESDQAHARLALRQALHGIRSALGAGAVIGRGAEEISLDPAAECDVVDFDRAISDGRLADALDLYRGELLRGFYVRDAPDFERWLEDERARRRAAATTAAADLADRCTERGAVGEGIRYLRGALRFAPLDERLVRRLIALLDRMGDRAAALAVYDDFHARLAAELEVEPSPETLALIAAVRARATVGSADNLPVPPPRPVVSETAPLPVPRASSAHAVRTRIAWGVGALGIAALALGAAWRVRTHAALSPRRVLVTPFTNRTGDSALAPLGGYAADWVARGLALTGTLEIADGGGPGEEPAGRQPVRSLARRARAGLAVWGTIDRRGQQIELAAHVSDLERRRQVQSLEPVTVDPADPRPALVALRERLMTVLSQAVDRRFNDPGWVAVQPPLYEAYLAFATGLDLAYNQVDVPAGLTSLRRAAALDSSYTLPLIYEALLSFYLGTCDSAEALAGRLARMTLIPTEQWQVDRELARCGGDFSASYRLSRRLAEALPESDVMRFALIRDALQVDRPREALAQSRRIDLERGALRDRVSTYVLIATAHHWISDHRRELSVARDAGVTARPAAAARSELVALAALGRIDALNERLEAFAAGAASVVPTLPPTRRYAGTVMRETALELAAHGHQREAAAVLARTLAWLATRPPAELASDYVRFERAQTFYAAGRPDSARQLVEPLARSHPENADYVGLLGVLAALDGDHAGAERADTLLSALERPLGTAAFWRACIAARLGERDRAVDLLARARTQGQWLFQNAMNRRYFHVLGAHVEPSFDHLRGYAPFDALVRPKG